MPAPGFAARLARRAARWAARDAAFAARSAASSALLVLYVRVDRQITAAVRFSWAHGAAVVLPQELLQRILAMAL